MSGSGPEKNNDLLPLSSQEYYELLELLIFNINLPNVGMAQTLKILQEDIPMHCKIKEQYV